MGVWRGHMAIRFEAADRDEAAGKLARLEGAADGVGVEFLREDREEPGYEDLARRSRLLEPWLFEGTEVGDFMRAVHVAADLAVSASNYRAAGRLLDMAEAELARLRASGDLEEFYPEECEAARAEEARVRDELAAVDG